MSRSQDSRDDDERRGGIAASAAAWAFSFLVLRVFAVSGYDWKTAFAVSTTISVDDGLGLLFGSFMAGEMVVSLVLVVLVPLLIATLLWSSGGRRPVVILPTCLGLATMVALTVSFRRWWLPPSVMIVMVVFWLVRKLPHERPVRRVFTAVTARIGWTAGVAVLSVAVFTQTPWVPLERIETTNGIVNAYVLSIDSGFLNLLSEEHEFVILVRDDVLSRE